MKSYSLLILLISFGLCDVSVLFQPNRTRLPGRQYSTDSLETGSAVSIQYISMNDTSPMHISRFAYMRRAVIIHSCLKQTRQHFATMQYDLRSDTLRSHVSTHYPCSRDSHGNESSFELLTKMGMVMGIVLMGVGIAYFIAEK